MIHLKYISNLVSVEFLLYVKYQFTKCSKFRSSERAHVLKWNEAHFQRSRRSKIDFRDIKIALPKCHLFPIGAERTRSFKCPYK